MGAKFRRRTVYVATIAAILSMVGGFALASFTLGGFSNAPLQSGSNNTPNPPTGVSFTSSYAQLASLTSPAATGKCTATDSSTSTVTDAMVSGSTIFVCLNSVGGTGFLAPDTIEQATIAWSTAASASTVFELAIYFGGLTTSPVQAFVTTPATILATSSVLIAYDMTAGGKTSVSSVSVIVSQCTGTTCP